jgi:hypothetical protein
MICSSWTRINLTSYRNPTIQHPTRSLLNTAILIAWWVTVTWAHHRPLEIQLRPNNSRIILHSTARCILHSTARCLLHSTARCLLHSTARCLLHPLQTHECLEAPFINCRLGIWINLLHSNRISRTERSYWINIPNHMPTTTNNATVSSNHHLGFEAYQGADKSLARPTSRCILFDS